MQLFTLRSLVASALLCTATVPVWARSPVPPKENPRLEQAERRIQEALEADKITEEQANEKRAHLRRTAREHAERGEAKRAHMEKMGQEIKHAVEAGKITPEEGRAKWAALTQHHEKADEMQRWEGIKKRIEGAVERGDLSAKRPIGSTAKSNGSLPRSGSTASAVGARSNGTTKSGAITSNERN